MKTTRTWHWSGIALVLVLLLGTGAMLLTVSTAKGAETSEAIGESDLSPATSSQADRTRIGGATTSASAPSSLQSLPDLAPDEESDDSAAVRSLMVPGDVLEVFTNTWSYSTIGLVYDPGRGQVRYAHESQSSTHNPTVYDVDSVTHSPVLSFALSTVNGSWPWQIDNRDGAGYDFVNDTYFLPDYNGDLSYADDNIVEVDAGGTILNVWEMDDEVGSNDSSDGSEIDSIIDIAVVPGSPTRYFATAAYDGSVVYEIALQKTGAWWTPNSWHTVATYTLPVLNDNLGIDYDAEHEVLFHSGWHTTTVLITDLGLNPIAEPAATFDCPGAGGYNSGITYLEGSDPAEVWVTDFGSDKTTRCETPFAREVVAPGWKKVVAGLPWSTGFVLETQTGDVVQVTDIITGVEPFTLTEIWDPAHLELLNADVVPPVGTVITSPGSIDTVVPAGPPEVVTVSKWFRIKPCNWTVTTLEEGLVVEGGPAFDPRPVTIEKLPPVLEISSTYEEEVYTGGLASFTLHYSNTGGYETGVWISNTFPVTAPFVFAEPFPDEVGPSGTWARWDLGDLAQGAMGQIEVNVLIDETVPASNTITIWDGIFDHLDVLRDETWIDLHVNDEAFPLVWDKVVNERVWQPGLAVTLETSQTLLIQEEILPPTGNPEGFVLIEEWNPEELALSSWDVQPIPYNEFVETPSPGVWILSVPPTVDFGPVTLVKELRVEPCTWPETVLWEGLSLIASPAFRSRPVVVQKRQPDLWIDSFFDVSVYSREWVEFELTYGNAGGFETRAWIRNDFPPEALFVESDPPPTDVDADRRWAIWELGELAADATGSIGVAVEIAPGLPPSTTLPIWDGIFNHVDELADETEIVYHVPPPTWNKWVNGAPWTPDLGVSVQTSDTLTVTDIISTHSAAELVEHWNPEHLILDRYTIEPEAGQIHQDANSLAWEFPQGVPGTITLTKFFHVQPCTWTYTVLWEDLWVETVEWERRPVQLDKMPSELWIDSVFEPEVPAGHSAGFALLYGNLAGLESRAWIHSTFPPESPFVASVPPPGEVGPGGQWATWDLGLLAMHDEGEISVEAAIGDQVTPGTPLAIESVIHDHVDVVRDAAVTRWTVVSGTHAAAVYLPLVVRSYEP